MLKKTPTCAKHESTFQPSKGVISAPPTCGKADKMSKRFLMFTEITSGKGTGIWEEQVPAQGMSFRPRFAWFPQAY